MTLGHFAGTTKTQIRILSAMKVLIPISLGLLVVGCGEKGPPMPKGCGGTEHLSASELYKELYEGTGEKPFLTRQEFSVRCGDCHSRDY